MFEYKVETVRETLVGDKVDSEGVQDILSERAKEGWRLHSVVDTKVKGRIGPGGSEGLLLIFERGASS
jgi:hypothetical protein